MGMIACTTAIMVVLLVSRFGSCSKMIADGDYHRNIDTYPPHFIYLHFKPRHYRFRLRINQPGCLDAPLPTPGYTTNPDPRGRLLPPCTDGSAHHFAASRRTPTYVSSSNPSRSQTTRRSSSARFESASAR